MEPLKKLPIGVEEFTEFISDDFYYIDKTMFIAELLQNRGKVNLFTRPRRFGKSLNMSMLKSFFEIGGKLHLFDGLKISDETELCRKYMGQFPVIFLTLKTVDGLSFAQAKEALKFQIGEEAERFNFLSDSAQLTENQKLSYRALTGKNPDGSYIMSDIALLNSIKTLSQLLSVHFDHKVLILIDEYDVPLDKAFQNKYYDEMISLLRSLFGNALKGNSSLYFAVLTGCLRISKESIFTGLNNLNVMSITDDYFDEYFGFTDDEVLELLHYLNLTSSFDTVKQWYNGYRFGSRSIYCPWDVIKYCQALCKNGQSIPEDYWANTSGNDMVKRFIALADQQTRDEIEQLISGASIIKEINQELTYNDLNSNIDNLWSVLFTTGYLTIKEKLSVRVFRLVIPNREIHDLFTRQIKEWFREKALAEPEKLNELGDAFFTGNTELIQQYLTDYLKQTISIRDSSVQKPRKENFYHGLLLGLLSYPKRWSITSNEESGDGYSDILVRDEATDTRLVIEIKYAENGTFDSSCTEALKQIEAKNYTEALKTDGITNILKYGISFYKKRCRVFLGV